MKDVFYNITATKLQLIFFREESTHHSLTFFIQIKRNASTDAFLRGAIGILDDIDTRIPW